MTRLLSVILSSEGAIDLGLLSRLLAAEELQPLSAPQDWQPLENKYGPGFSQAMLYVLTRKEFSLPEARRHWRAILKHRVAMNQALGRDVGLRTALCDYFLNIEPIFKSPLLLEEELLAQRERTALHDELTGLFNRRYFNNVLARQVTACQRHEQCFSLLMIDVDRFKAYNDRFGHLAGDRALVEMGRVLQSSARAMDYVVRYGGEEFAVILPRTDKEQALRVAERHRRAAEEHYFAGEELMPGERLTISMGVACFPDDADDLLGLIARADEALYQAKRRGRNRVCSARSDRRRHPRVPCQDQVRFRDLGCCDNAFRQGQALDISQGGLRVRSGQSLEPGRPVEIVIQAQDLGLEVVVRGEVAHLSLAPGTPQPYQLGMSLTASARNPSFQHLLESRKMMYH